MFMGVTMCCLGSEPLTNFTFSGLDFDNSFCSNPGVKMAQTQLEFQNVQIEKARIGIGNKILVYKAMCDGLPCAAKILHPTVHDVPSGIKEQFELMSRCQHPNIVQYLGTTTDSETRQPVFLVELMDGNLTQFLGQARSQGKLPYHLQVDICHDICKALNYLHSNGIIHCNLSSRNVLLSGDKAKVDISTSFILREEPDCPGKPPYMPPEGFGGQFTCKLDCFSFGVLAIETITCENAEPGPRSQSEVERRKPHIEQIKPDHPLLPIVLECLKDKDTERPSSQELCRHLAALKEGLQYTRSVHKGSIKERQLAKANEEKGRELDAVKHQLKEMSQQLARYQEGNENSQQPTQANQDQQDKSQQLAQASQELQDKSQQLAQANGDLEDKTRQLEQANQELHEKSEQLAQASQELRETSRQLAQRNESQRSTQCQLDQANEEVQSLSRQLQQLCVAQPQLPSTDVTPWTVPRTEVEIQDQIGGGAWGAVAKGRFLNQQVAVKWPYAAIINTQTLDRLRREVRIMAEVRHPNLLRFIAAVFDDQTPPLIITELLDMNLRTAYVNGHLKSANKLPIFCDVAYALHYLHEHEEPIIHRDVSAPNVLLEALPGGTWRAKISDFGSANVARLAQTLGEGALIYSAPETFPIIDPDVNPPPQTTKIDIYSYGIMLCEVINCQLPDPVKYRDMLQQVQRQWQFMYDLIVLCTKHNPDERPTMLQVLDRLNKLPRPHTQQ